MGMPYDWILKPENGKLRLWDRKHNIYVCSIIFENWDDAMSYIDKCAE